MLRRTALASLGLASLGLASVAAPALGAEGTEIASSFDEDDPFDLFVTVRYEFEARHASIKREFAGLMGSMVDGPVPVVKDLRYKQTRHLLTPRLEVGAFRDLQLHAELPIVLADGREYGWDQTADPCIFANDPQGRMPTCIDIRNSSTVGIDGFRLLPDGTMGGGMGYDAGDPMANFDPVNSKTVFRGVNRKGLDTINFGLTWAPVNQEKDDTKPTWVIGAEFRLSIGQIMKFNRFMPGTEDGVSEGVHWFRASTGLSKRTTWAEPYVFFWWQAPIGVRGDTPEDPEGSLFWDVGFGQENKTPQQQAGTVFGFEAIPWENKRQKQKIALQLQGRVEAHFEGRGYSEAWELFAYAGDRIDNPGGPLLLDSDPVAAGAQLMSHPGVTDIENYLTWGGRMGVRGQVGERAKFDASFEISGDQQHRISWTDAGREGADADDVITPGTAEVNPLHRQIIDVVGRRYIAGGSAVFTFLVGGTLLF